MKPLADQLRPKTLEEVVGQSHLIGEGKPLRKLVEQQELFSMILWGPPGVGKTTLARLLAQETDRDFFEVSAVSAGKKELREVIQAAESNQKDLLTTYKAPVLFVDEIHRFNKAQQDYLLPYVEDGTIMLIGATTENPSFEIISPLLSRTRVFTLNQLDQKELEHIIEKAISYLKKSFPKIKKPSQEAIDWLIQLSQGDGRQLLTLIDHTLQLYQDLEPDHLKATAEKSHLRYDQAGEEHYNTISAFIKSMRASNPDAALYYLSRMLAAGEDPKFIARRMVVFASEDIGLAQPTALVVANAVFAAVEKVGLPEGAINLAHGVCYLAEAKKDRRAYDALRAAQADVERFGPLPIPLKLRNAPTDLMKELDYGKDYQMYGDKNLLPEKLTNKKYLQRKPNVS